MSAAVRDCFGAAGERREENGEEGFSLIELIVVVVILGILAAVAIPIFAGIQDSAETNSLEAVAANGASQVSSAVSLGGDDVPVVGGTLDNLSKDGIVVTITRLTAGDIDSICVTATKGAGTQTAGPGCD